MNRIESLILHSLIYNEPYTRKALPFITGRYFSHKKERFLFEKIGDYIEKYNSTPTPEVISLSISEASGITEQEETDILDYLNELTQMDVSNVSEQWLLDETERFCQERSVHNAILDSISILNGENKKLDKGAIPNILSEALSVSFDTNVGHDYVEDSDARFEFYHRKEKKVPFDLDSFNKITKGGLTEKTLNIILAATGTGKTLVMNHMAAANLTMGQDVLYITLEMSEEKIAERIDANLLDISMNDIEELPKPMYDRKIAKLKQNVKGRLMIKEYPTANASVNHFRALLDEMKMKKNFVPDIIYIDYMNIAASARLRMGNSVNSYNYVKSIAEELRGLAVEYAVPIVTATQSNRNAFADSDVGLDGTSDSFGTTFTADMMFAVMSSEDMQERGQYLIKQLKNRYQDPTFMRRFIIGVDYAKMRLYEVENPLDGLYENNEEKQQDTSGPNKRRSNKGRFDSLNIGE